MNNKSKRPKGFTLYTDLKPLVDRLPGENLLKAMYSYVCDGVEPLFDDDTLQFAWEIFKIKLDASIEYHQQAVKSGRKGGLARARNQKQAKQPQATLRQPKGIVATRQDRTRQDCLKSQPCSFPGWELTAEDELEEYAKLNEELADDG